MKRSGFSMIELVFVIVILGVLAAVAVPRFVATRTDAQVATARSDLASAQKAIVAKVFADDIDPTYSKAPIPTMKAADALAQGKTMDWGDWIIEVAGLDKSRWQKGGNPMTKWGVNQQDGIQPIGNVKNNGAQANGGVAANGGGGKGGCGAILGISTQKGTLEFQPQNMGGDNSGSFCSLLAASYKNSTDAGNKSIPLASTNTISF